jgi:hypothetical protein
MERVELIIGGLIVVIDSADLYFVQKYSWHIVDKTRHKTRKLYVEHTGNIPGFPKRHVTLHRFLLGLTDPEILVDHIDGNGLNNTRGNLRITTRKGNSQNTAVRADSVSGVKGAMFYKKSGRYQATIRVDGTNIYLGTYGTAREANEVYAAAAVKHFGEYARAI